MDAAVKTFGRIDILVNNAGITRDGLLMMMKESDFDDVIRRQPPGHLPLHEGRVPDHDEAALRPDREPLQRGGAPRGNAGQVNYAASKAGVIGMTKSLAKELASRGVTVNAVAPGFIATDMTAAMTDAAKERHSGRHPHAAVWGHRKMGPGRGLPGQR